MRSSLLLVPTPTYEADVPRTRRYRDQTVLFAKLAAQSAALSHTDSALFSATPSGMRGSRPAVRFRKLEEGEEEGLRKKVEEGARARLVKRVEGL